MSDLVVPLVCLLVIVVVIGAVIAVVLRRGKPQAAPAAEPAPKAEPAPPASPAAERPRPPAPERRTRTAPVRLRPLPDDARRRYATAWEGVRARFREQPVLALSQADTVLGKLLAERGLPADDPAATLAPEHARLVASFRAGRAVEQANTTLRSDEEQVRQGMAHFEEVFAGLLADDPVRS